MTCSRCNACPGWMASSLTRVLALRRGQSDTACPTSLRSMQNPPSSLTCKGAIPSGSPLNVYTVSTRIASARQGRKADVVRELDQAYASNLNLSSKAPRSGLCDYLSGRKAVARGRPPPYTPPEQQGLDHPGGDA